MFTKIPLGKFVLGTFLASLIHSLALPATAQTAQLGVVRSPDNAVNWSGITSRVQSTGVPYCIVDFAQVRQASDLGKTQFLLLPNIERLEPVQLQALQDWTNQGGRLIVTGPMGTLSQPETRNQLRSLLGAYWGFALTKPSTLAALGINKNWIAGTGLANPIQGGVVIPAGLNATTAAVWSQGDNQPPAVVTTEKTTFFGWNWGSEAVAPAATDSAWLRAALSRYGVTASAASKAASSAQFCVPAQAAALPLPNLSAKPATVTKVAQNEPDFGVVPLQVQPTQTGSMTAREVAAMSQELENLIGRFESALLAANATNSSVMQTSAAIAQFPTTATKASVNSNPQTTTAGAIGAIANARTGLQNFRNAVAQRDYNRARQQWFAARRALWDNYPTDRKRSQAEVRAIWLDRGTIVRAKSEQDLAKVFDQLAAAGFNTVFFETVNASYPIYPSRVAPQQNPLVKGWDPLEAAVKLAHARGMELHAWVWIFAAANRRHNAILNQSADYPGPVLTAHPDWAMFDGRGRLFDVNNKKAFFDPANPEVRNYLMSLLDEIATRYKVDGIQLDYIRYPFQDPSVNQTYGYGRAGRQQFQAQTGVDPINVRVSDRVLWQKWTDFRIQQIDSFVATVSQRLRAQRPNLI
ncbi:family 10 glycosylhydrolase, partial [Microcoleus sp. herbarium7]|uniref:family 10 glycosylhydrolase n=1 Tax=Microcoleus sp. herbarium7 TaxID=3055435 RepID=UPI002FCF6DF9